MVEGAALEMLCPQKGPRVRIPDSPLYETACFSLYTMKSRLFYYLMERIYANICHNGREKVEKDRLQRYEKN